MPILADAQAVMTAATARLTVHHGRNRTFAGRDLPAPRRMTVPTRHGRVRCDVYSDPAREMPAPVHVHLHGGAFVMRYPKMDDFWCRYLVAEAGVTVVNVDYDVAPRRRYPVAQEQTHDVLAWVQGHGEWDRSRLTVSGFSAGGNLAASACLQALDHGTPLPRLQLLGVPSLDVSTVDKPAPAGAMVSPSVIDLVRKTYFRDAARRTEPYASPLLAPSVAGLPPTLVVTASRDRLRGEAVAYVARLREADVPVEHLDLPGRDHYFLDGPAVAARSVMDTMATAVATA